jgi:hypothetical protein
MLVTRYEQHCKDLPEFSLPEEQQLDKEVCTRTLYFRIEVEDLDVGVAVGVGEEGVCFVQGLVPGKMY